MARHAGDRVNCDAAEPVMFIKRATDISDGTRAPASAQAGEMHDLAGHHRYYYGSSACNGGERIVERRSGPRPRSRNVCGF
jgi:hypothetical protein